MSLEKSSKLVYNTPIQKLPFEEWVCPDCGWKFQNYIDHILPDLVCCGSLNDIVDKWIRVTPKALAERHGLYVDGSPAKEEGKKNDDEKPRTDLLPPGALLGVSEVLSHGAKKYGDDNWRKVTPRSRYIAAILRHVLKYMGGERLDKESGLHHLYHAACCALFLAQWASEGEL